MLGVALSISLSKYGWQANPGDVAKFMDAVILEARGGLPRHRSELIKPTLIIHTPAVSGQCLQMEI